MDIKRKNMKSKDICIIGATFVHPTIGDISYVNSYDSDAKLKVKILKYVRTHNQENYVLYEYVNSGLQEIMKYTDFENMIRENMSLINEYREKYENPKIFEEMCNNN